MTDYTKISKTEWLALGRDFYAHLFAELDKFSDREWHASTRYLGWNCKDLINHMTSAVTINFSLLIQKALDGNPVPEMGFNLFLRNAQEVARRRSKTVKETLDEFKIETMKLLGRLDTLTETQWLMPAFFFIGDVDIRHLFLVQFADNLVHERDLMVANNCWRSFDQRFINPLMDWFLREFHPASFRPEKFEGGPVTLQYSIAGVEEGNWLLQFKDYTCTPARGNAEDADVKVVVSVEDLISMALARPAPFIGKLARSLEWLVKKEKREDFTAKVTGIVASLSALLGGKVKIEGDKRLGKRIMKKWFWHFWERTEQTQDNIMRSKYKK